MTYRLQLAGGRLWLTPGQLYPSKAAAVQAMDQHTVARVVRSDGLLVAGRNRSGRWVMITHDGGEA